MEDRALGSCTKLSLSSLNIQPNAPEPELHLALLHEVLDRPEHTYMILFGIRDFYAIISERS